jgi:hypothetical protein
MHNKIIEDTHEAITLWYLRTLSEEQREYVTIALLPYHITLLVRIGSITPILAKISYRNYAVPSLMVETQWHYAYRKLMQQKNLGQFETLLKPPYTNLDYTKILLQHANRDTIRQWKENNITGNSLRTCVIEHLCKDPEKLILPCVLPEDLWERITREELEEDDVL